MSSLNRVYTSDSDWTAKAFLVIGFFVLGIVEIIPMALVLMVIWSWFAVPMGAPALPFAAAMGVFLARLLLFPAKAPSRLTGKDLRDHCLEAILLAVTILGMAWVVHRFL